MAIIRMAVLKEDPLRSGGLLQINRNRIAPLATFLTELVNMALCQFLFFPPLAWVSITIVNKGFVCVEISYKQVKNGAYGKFRLRLPLQAPWD